MKTLGTKESDGLIDAVEEALKTYGITGREYLHCALLMLITKTDEARTDLVNDMITYGKQTSVEVRKKELGPLGKLVVSRETIDTRLQ